VPSFCFGCGNPVSGATVIYRGRVVCSITCEDIVDLQPARPDPVSVLIDEWLANGL